MPFKLPSLLLCALVASCSSVTYREDVAQAADRASVKNLRGHLVALTDLGPRPASHGKVAEQTVLYLEQQLRAIGVEFEREVFELTPSAKLVLSLQTANGDSEKMPIPGVYFSANISQARVVQGLAEAKGVRDRMDGYGIESGQSQPVPQINLIATIPGSKAPERVLELSAHHDTVPGTVGAGDNTSGVVALLEVARLLQETPPDCTVRLCFFAAEEIGLLGSKEHLRILQDRNQIDQVFALINLDVVGFFTDQPNTQESPARIPLIVWPPTTGNFLALIGANGSADLGGLIEDAGELYTPDLPTYSLARLGGMFPDARRSDHAHYWDLDIPAIFLSDTGEFRGDHYHRPSDDLDHVNLTALRSVAALVYASAMSAAENEAAKMAE
jgi:peptidase M28-like protein